MRKLGLSGLCVLLVCALSACASAATSDMEARVKQAGDSIGQTVQECASWTDHRAEVCAAYVVNDAHWSLQPYYKYVHSSSLLSGLKSRLPLKYRGAALSAIRARAANWPAGTNTVEGPHITVLAARSSLKCNKGVLTTREDWRVIAPDGRVLYAEKGRVHTVTLRRVPDERFRIGTHVLHAWVVYDISDGRKSVSLTC